MRGLHSVIKRILMMMMMMTMTSKTANIRRTEVLVVVHIAYKCQRAAQLKIPVLLILVVLDVPFCR